jgi:hypothetical protein
MDPTVLEFVVGLLGGALVGLTVVLRTRHPPPKAMPVLAIRKQRSVSSARQRRTSLPTSAPNAVTFTKTKRKNKAKTTEPERGSQPPGTISAAVPISFDTCPSCGLQAPESLLAEHFIGSPSHRNGPPKIVKADVAEDEAIEEAREDDSRQSVRSLLQMLVPPRAFGRRHAHRSVSPISPIVKNLGPPHGRYP